MSNRVGIQFHVFDKATVPITNFNMDSYISEKDNLLKNHKTRIHSQVSQKKITSGRNKNLQIIYKISSSLSQPLNVEVCQKSDSLVFSPPKNPQNTIVMKRKEKTEQAFQAKFEPEQNYKNFPSRTWKLKNNNPYKYYMFNHPQKKVQAIDRFYSQQVRAKTAKQRPPRMQFPVQSIFFKRAPGSKKKERKKPMTGRKKDQKYLSPWYFENEENREDIFQ